jgi:hypothetical protein
MWTMVHKKEEKTKDTSANSPVIHTQQLSNVPTFRRDTF